MRAVASFLLMGVLGLAPVASAQAPAAPPAAAPDPNPLTAEARRAVERISGNLLRMAEKMPEEHYGFQAVPEIRTFAATLGHTIDSRTRTCASLSGSGAQPGASALKAKADLVAAMKASIAECEKAFATLTDATIVGVVTGGRGGPRSRLAAIYGMVAHDNEEYGYLAVHMRLKGVVPPSSEAAPPR
ncbi:hypothetical protein TBR22_A12460 [Luteitalea sp. TBR-22]|uniref:DinB family protein n=1 Tax=Luteitalea sp. TBR-22 TaxID=2802971 RepID=UPI001AFC5D58|nr:DinB family protein [Luteitalea sp. TBR-22]BCS32041.1 hypothetical protein TBR22_A12460 [Luteitalea sp. TBR-22]